MTPKPTPPSRAWLLEWVGVGPHVAMQDEIAAILPFRWNRDRIATIMRILYNLRTLSAAELALIARNVRNETYQVNWHNDHASLGGNPALFATPVLDLSVSTAPDGIETISFTMPPLYRAKPGSSPIETEVTRGPLARTIIRKARGPLNSRPLGG